MQRFTGSVFVPSNEYGSGALAANDYETLDLDAVLRFLRRSWRTCVSWGCATVVAGLLFSLLSTSYYTASTTLLLEERTGGRPGEANIPAVIDPSYAESQLQILKSEEVVGRVIDRLNLADVPEFAGGRGLGALLTRLIPFASSTSTAATSLARYAVFKQVDRSLSLRRIGLSNAIEISVTSQDPNRAAQIATGIARAFIEMKSEQRREAREESTIHLRQRLDQVREEAFANVPAEQEPAAATVEARERARVRFRELQNKSETYRLLYINILQQLNQLALDDYFLAGARIIIAAHPPNERSWPRTPLVLAVSALAGLVLGIGHGLLRQLTDQSIRGVEDLRRSVPLDQISMVPRLNVEQWEFAQPFGAEELQTAYSMTAEVLRDAVIKMAVRSKWGVGSGHQSIIGVVSPTPRAGSSTIAAHLARALADSCHSTLLIDANWHKIPEHPASYQQLPHRLARARTSVELEAGRLDVLSLRAIMPLSGLNASLSILDALQSLETEQSVSCVIVDFESTQMCADMEACLPKLTDLVIVAEPGRTSIQSLHEMLRLISETKIKGVVMNKS